MADLFGRDIMDATRCQCWSTKTDPNGIAGTYVCGLPGVICQRGDSTAVLCPTHSADLGWVPVEEQADEPVVVQAGETSS